MLGSEGPFLLLNQENLDNSELKEYFLQRVLTTLRGQPSVVGKVSGAGLVVQILNAPTAPSTDLWDLAGEGTQKPTFP